MLRVERISMPKEKEIANLVVARHHCGGLGDIGLRMGALGILLQRHGVLLQRHRVRLQWDG